MTKQDAPEQLDNLIAHNKNRDRFVKERAPL